MKQPFLFALLSVALIILVIAYLGGTNSCSVKWAKPDNGLTLEQKGLLVNLAAKNMIVQLRINEPGEWQNHVCSLATIVVDALDGDDASIRKLNSVLAEPLSTAGSITVPIKTLLLDLLSHVASSFDLHGWESSFADAITILDAFVLSSVTIDQEVWYLTREFFAGIVSGCDTS